MVCIKAVINYLATRSVIFLLLCIVYKETAFSVYSRRNIFKYNTNPQKAPV
ncbi:uncharacterized protein NEPG_01301 [Nematocida parisii ERTm1]|uniref:Uncharacterized protein n=1 Tax=Nematocida parisii (strain ERTm3) TaxID=935791 RepID=I3EG57_NEMP3|nr:uncharacterized protein NEPG_01301 [Nematocida parisii ERTm1]EIJ88204.1 hypothetical protein NEQG_01648 [Nematocida parisii ERTm3]EIJ93729.1 hypothetical protein NEPG_01301 [Nematocida parisii ERTm1]|eukprot:XP_013059129.1 hypothetical protein NEPG_01301 [Nematocida parisii ERTm1]